MTILILPQLLLTGLMAKTSVAEISRWNWRSAQLPALDEEDVVVVVVVVAAADEEVLVETVAVVVEVLVVVTVAAVAVVVWVVVVVVLAAEVVVRAVMEIGPVATLIVATPTSGGAMSVTCVTLHVLKDLATAVVNPEAGEVVLAVAAEVASAEVAGVTVVALAEVVVETGVALAGVAVDVEALAVATEVAEEVLVVETVVVIVVVLVVAAEDPGAVVAIVVDGTSVAAGSVVTGDPSHTRRATLAMSEAACKEEADFCSAPSEKSSLFILISHVQIGHYCHS